MNQLTLAVLAFIGGLCLAAQGGLNAQLGVLLKNPLLAAVVSSVSSSLIAGLLIAFTVKAYPSVQQLNQVPGHLWLAGGLLSVLGLSVYFFTIPKLGISTVISVGLSGQLLFSVIASHLGWFNLPVQSIDSVKIIGVVTMVIGMLLINYK